jgi:hypothetical protein
MMRDVVKRQRWWSYRIVWRRWVGVGLMLPLTQ